MTDVFGFIRSEKAGFPVPRMCHKFAVARASFYRWLHTGVSPPTWQRHQLLNEHAQRAYDREPVAASESGLTCLKNLTSATLTSQVASTPVVADS